MQGQLQGAGFRDYCHRMKAILPVTALGCLLMFTGCGDSSSGSGQGTNSTASSGNPITAPVDYLGAVGNAKQHAVKTIDVAEFKDLQR